MDHPELTNTVFGEVLAELLEARGLEVTPFKVGELAENAGLDGWKVIDRMSSAKSPRRLKHLNLRLAEKLDLSEPEMMELAYAFTFEQRREVAPYAEILGTVNGQLGGAIELLDDVPPEAFGDEDDYFRAKGDIAEAGGLVVRAQARQVEEAGDRPA